MAKDDNVKTPSSPPPLIWEKRHDKPTREECPQPENQKPKIPLPDPIIINKNYGRLKDE